jgi:hypothetical protein
MIGGYDVYVYSEMYELISDYNDMVIVIEPMFLFYYKILKLFSTDRYFMFFVSSVIVLGTYFYFLKKLSIWFYMSLFIFFCKFYLMSFVYLRQGIAMIFVLVSLFFLVKEQKIKAILITVLAILFHKSAIIFLPFLFIGGRRFSNLQMLLLIIIIALLSFSPLGSVLLVSAGNGLGEEKIVDYANKSGGVNLFYVIEGFLVLLLSFYFKAEFYLKKQNILFFNGMLFYGLIIIFGITNGTFVRLSWYYFMFICLGLPMIFSFINDVKLKQTFKNLIFVYYTLVFFRLMIVYDGGDFMPYKSIFQDFDRNGLWEYREYRTNTY